MRAGMCVGVCTKQGYIDLVVDAGNLRQCEHVHEVCVRGCVRVCMCVR